MRSIDVLNLVDEHGLVTVDWCQVVLGCSENAALKHLGRLSRSGQLGSWPLIHPQRYWARRKFGPQSLPSAFGVGAYCLVDGTCRRAVAKQEEHPVDLRTLGETVVTAAGTEIVRVDLGGDAGHVVRKARRFLRRNKALDLSSLTYVFLTATEEKAASIEKSLQQHTWPFALKIVVVDDLLHLLTEKR